MIMRQQVALIAAVFCVLSPPLHSASSSSIWSGAGTDAFWTNGANWQGGGAPLNGADVILDNSSLGRSIYLNTSPSLNSLLVGGSDFCMSGFDGAATLTLGSGGLTVGGPAIYSSLIMDPNALIALDASQTWTIGSEIDRYSSAALLGDITGISENPLTVAVYGSLALGGNNDFAGTVTLNGGQLFLGSDTALGSATVVANGSSTISNFGGDRVLGNDIMLNGGSTTLDAGTGSLTFGGTFTVTNPTDINVFGAGPVIFSGTMSETGGSQAISKSGGGMLVVKGTVGVSGGISINDGLVIVGSIDAKPAPGAVGVYDNGYFGLDLGTGIPAADFVGGLNGFSSGTIGFDTATPASPAIVSEDIDLSGFSGNPRLGSATSAKITGTITPGGGGYQFGGGGGMLEVASNLTGERSLNLYSPFGERQELTLILSGSNSYLGDTTIDNSLLRFANPAALTGLPGSFNFSNRGYLGLDFVPLTADLESLWSRTDPGGATVVMGFDSPKPAAPNTETISTDSLGHLPSGAYLGTSTSATIGITQGDAEMPSNLSFAALRDGHLTVSSLPDGAYSLTIGLPNDYNEAASADYEYSSRNRGLFATSLSTVTLAGGNNYSGGTTLQGGRVELGAAGALGTGAIHIAGDVTLATTASGFAIANDIEFPVAPVLTLDATNSFILSGAISGDGIMDKIGLGTLRLEGDNSAFIGHVNVDQGLLEIANDAAVANANLYLYGGDGGGVASFLTAAPRVASLNGDGAINLDNAALTINSGYSVFSGNISGTGGSIILDGTTNTSGTVYTVPYTNSSVNVSLSGNNTYSGGTLVSGTSTYSSTLIAGNSTALGTGPVSVSGGSLYLNNNAILANTLNFSTGTIGGIGTFAPPGGVAIGSSQFVVPGISHYYTSDLYNTAIGALGFGTGLTLASGGTYVWELADASGVAGTGWDEILVTGTLTIASTSGSPFILSVSPVAMDAVYHGPRVFDNTQFYSWTIASTTGGIIGFDPSAIAIDPSGFGSGLGSGYLFLSQSGSDLMLNFTPVPEPSTYALMGLGLGVVVVGLRRRKRR